MAPDRSLKKRAEFLEALSELCNVSRACKVVGVARRTVYQWRENDPDFDQEFVRARRVGAEALEDEAVRRAHEGVEKRVFYKGELVDTVREYSDTLLIFLLKGAKPEVYKDRVANELSGPNGEPLHAPMTPEVAEREIFNIMNAALARKNEAEQRQWLEAHAATPALSYDASDLA